jgi:1-acyl-sn-glycerol-3-phosphate acyltransferase
MAVLRSLLFNLALVLWTIVYGVVVLPLVFAPRAVCLKVGRFWNKAVLALLGWLVGLRYEVRGLENVPPRPCVLAVKHQSAFETLALPLILEDPVFVLKRELFLIPLFGWYLARLGMIGIDRRAGPKALMSIVRRAKAALEAGHHVVIFPEGTRVAPYVRRPYNPGVAALYAHAEAPVVPVALNSGLFWGRRHFVKRPGTVTIEFLPPIPQGLERAAFMAELEARIEGATGRLLDAAKTQLLAQAGP